MRQKQNKFILKNHNSNYAIMKFSMGITKWWKKCKREIVTETMLLYNIMEILYNQNLDRNYFIMDIILQQKS